MAASADPNLAALAFALRGLAAGRSDGAILAAAADALDERVRGVSPAAGTARVG